MPIRPSAPISGLACSAYRVPTDAPESDGTIEWSSTTIVVVEAAAAERTGLGYTYSHVAIVDLVEELLRPVVCGHDAMDTTKTHEAMVRAVRNVGRPGLAAAAISAVDVGLWDLKARLLDLPLVTLLGGVRDRVATYGSGGFTSYDERRLCDQLGRWVFDDGCTAVKMKVGREPHRDLDRVRAARGAIGAAELYVDANGAYERKQSLRFAEEFAPFGVTWFEEPVSSDDVAGLRLLRDRVPGGMRIAAGEYGYDAFDFLRLLAAGACDVLQADATRCGGVTGFLRVATLAGAWNVPLSAHTAPALHATLGCAAEGVMNVEYFHDHVRLERLLFDGVPTVRRGCLEPDRTRPGLGLDLKRRDAEQYLVRAARENS